MALTEHSEGVPISHMCTGMVKNPGSWRCLVDPKRRVICLVGYTEVYTSKTHTDSSDVRQAAVELLKQGSRLWHFYFGHTEPVTIQAGTFLET